MKALIINTFTFLISVYICSSIKFLVTCTEQYRNAFCTFIKNDLPTCCHWHLPTQNEVGGRRKITGPVANRGMQVERQSKGYYAAAKLLSKLFKRKHIS